MIVLGIETSCDETGVALYDSEVGLRAHALFSQVKIHAEYGGVVPEIASRDHVRKLLPLINQCLEYAGLTRNDIDAVAYTAGPGLIGALLVGTAIGRSIAMALGPPGAGGPSYGRPPAGADARSRPPDSSVCGVAGFGRPYHPDRGTRDR